MLILYDERIHLRPRLVTGGGDTPSETIVPETPEAEAGAPDPTLPALPRPRIRPGRGFRREQGAPVLSTAVATTRPAPGTELVPTENTVAGGAVPVPDWDTIQFSDDGETEVMEVAEDEGEEEGV